MPINSAASTKAQRMEVIEDLLRRLAGKGFGIGSTVQISFDLFVSTVTSVTDDLYPGEWAHFQDALRAYGELVIRMSECRTPEDLVPFLTSPEGDMSFRELRRN